jgi:hypothetical protein
MYSGSHFDLSTRKWEVGTGYNFTIFSKQERGSLMPISDGTFTRYSDLVSVLILLCDSVVFIVLTWYFDRVVESNRGRSDSPLFPLLAILKLFRKSSKAESVIPEQIRNSPLQDEEESTIRERDKVWKDSKNKKSAFGLRIKDLSKTFSKMCSKQCV